MWLSFTISSLHTELAERDTINQPVIYCTLIGGCLKWIPSQESTPDRSPLMAVYNWLIHIEWTPCFSRVSEVYVFFQSKLWESDLRKPVKGGKKINVLDSVECHFLSILLACLQQLNSEWSFLSLLFTELQLATNRMPGLRQLILHWIRLKYTVGPKAWDWCEKGFFFHYKLHYHHHNTLSQKQAFLYFLVFDM